MKAYLRSFSPSSQISNIKEPFKSSILQSTLEYYSPFKNIIDKNNQSTPKHIVERNKELKKIKERLNKLVEQTDRLSCRKRLFTMETRSKKKNTDIRVNTIKIQSIKQIDTPIKCFDIVKQQAQKNQQQKTLKEFNLGLDNKINKKKSLRNRPTNFGKKFTETRQCLSNRSQSELLDNPQRSLNQVKSLNSKNFSEIVSQQQHLRRKSMFILSNNKKSTSRYSDQKSKILHKDSIISGSGMISPQVKVICLQQQNRILSQKLKDLEGSRIYYQQQMIELIRKLEQMQAKQSQKYEQIKNKHQCIIKSYLNQIQQKDKKISVLRDKIIMNDNKNNYQYLCQKVQELQRQNDGYKSSLLKKDDEIIKICKKLAQQINISHELTIKNTLIQSQLNAVQQLRNNKFEKGKILSKEDELKIQLNKIQVYKKQIQSLKQANRNLKAELKENNKILIDIKNQFKHKKNILLQNSHLFKNPQIQINHLQNKIQSTLNQYSETQLNQNNHNFAKQQQSTNNNLKLYQKKEETQIKQNNGTQKIDKLITQLQHYRQYQ